MESPAAHIDQPFVVLKLLDRLQQCRNAPGGADPIAILLGIDRQIVQRRGRLELDLSDTVESRHGAHGELHGTGQPQLDPPWVGAGQPSAKGHPVRLDGLAAGMSFHRPNDDGGGAAPGAPIGTGGVSLHELPDHPQPVPGDPLAVLVAPDGRHDGRHAAVTLGQPIAVALAGNRQVVECRQCRVDDDGRRPVAVATCRPAVPPQHVREDVQPPAVARAGTVGGVVGRQAPQRRAAAPGHRRAAPVLLHRRRHQRHHAQLLPRPRPEGVGVPRADVGQERARVGLDLGHVGVVLHRLGRQRQRPPADHVVPGGFRIVRQVGQGRQALGLDGGVGEVRAHARYEGIDDFVDLVRRELPTEGGGGQMVGAEGAEEGGLGFGVGSILLVEGQLGQEGREVGHGNACFGWSPRDGRTVVVRCLG